MRPRLFGLILLVAVLALACDSGTDETREQKFEVGASPRLLVGAGNGDVIVRTGPDREIVVISDVTRLENVDLDVTADGDVVTVRSVTTFSGNLLGDMAEGRVDFTITVPVNTEIDVGVGSGAVTIEGARAGGRATAAAGDVTLRDVSGDFTGGTGVGDIAITNSSGSFQFTTGSGGITFEGELTPDGLNELETGVGDVTVTIPDDNGIALDVSVSDGSVSTEFAVADQPAGSPGRLSGTVGDGGAQLSIVVGVGSVDIRAASPVTGP